MRQIIRLKRVVFVVLICVIMGMVQGCTSMGTDPWNNVGNQLFNIDDDRKDENLKTQNENRILDYDEVKNKLIRFHVIANSDTEEDQNLKLKIKNKVIDYLYPYLNASQSLEESRNIIKDKMDEVKKLAEEVIKDNNYSYGVKTELSHENFPEKSYGKITLPQGNYEAFRIIIGTGQGKNWWCVMFPPLCFVDEAKAEVEYDKTEKRIDSQKDDFDFSINSNEEDDKSNRDEEKSKKIDKEDNKGNVEKQTTDKEKVQIKFKLVELIKNLFN
jgi:stage II sporulation protein R